MSNRTAYFYDPDVGNFHYGKYCYRRLTVQAERRVLTHIMLPNLAVWEFLLVFYFTLLY